jgi:hypothetical protein
MCKLIGIKYVQNGNFTAVEMEKKWEEYVEALPQEKKRGDRDVIEKIVLLFCWRNIGFVKPIFRIKAIEGAL